MAKKKPKQPRVTVGLRLPPSSKKDLRAVLDALGPEGVTRQEDLVGALLRRTTALVTDQTELQLLGAEARSQRARAKSEGF